MKHAGDANVVDEFELAGRHRRHIDARHRFAEDGPLSRRLALGLRVERQIEFFPGDQLTIGDASGFVAVDPYRAVGGSEAIRRDAKMG